MSNAAHATRRPLTDADLVIGTVVYMGNGKVARHIAGTEVDAIGRILVRNPEAKATTRPIWKKVAELTVEVIEPAVAEQQVTTEPAEVEVVAEPTTEHAPHGTAGSELHRNRPARRSPATAPRRTEVHPARALPEGVTTRPVGRDLDEVVVDGVAAGRILRGDTSWYGYDTTGLRLTGLGVATRAEAVAAVLAEVEAVGVLGPRR